MKLKKRKMKLKKKKNEIKKKKKRTLLFCNNQSMPG